MTGSDSNRRRSGGQTERDREPSLKDADKKIKETEEFIEKIERMIRNLGERLKIEARHEVRRLIVSARHQLGDAIWLREQAATTEPSERAKLIQSLMDAVDNAQAEAKKARQVLEGD